MSTTIRPELSSKNQYRIDRHRYYELKHFCLQYPSWKKACLRLDGYAERPNAEVMIFSKGGVRNPTAVCAEEKSYYADKIATVETAAQRTDPVIGSYILTAVTQGISYDVLKARLDVPCCKSVYYDLYRRFFWLLHKERG